MKVHILKIVCAVVAVVVFAPITTHAYKTTGSYVKRINDNYAMFAVGYTFGFLNRESYLPIKASRGTTASTTDLEYVMVAENGKTTTNGVVTALVLSNAEIKDGKYHLPYGKAANFALVGIMRLDSAAGEHPALSITDIPVIVVTDKKAALLDLPDGTFAKYQTKHVK